MPAARVAQLSRTRRRGIVPLTLALAGVMLLSTAGTALAVRKSTSAPQKFISTIIWGNWVSYSATWDVSETRDAGRTWWVISKLETKVNVSRYGECPNCTGRWLSSGRAEFLNAAGDVLYAYSLPIDDSCWGPWLIHPADLLIVRCKQGPMQLNRSVNRIRFKWTMSIEYGNGFWASANQQKTVSIN